jgi:aspartyl protease family protein
VKVPTIFFSVAIGGVLFASKMPAADGPGPAQVSHSTHANPWMKDSVKLEHQNDWNSADVSLPRSGDGHFYADVSIDGVPSRMLVDTGASVIALTGEDARAMGVTWSPDQVQPIGQGASGEVKGVPVTLDRVQLGNRELQSVQAVVIPEGLSISLLGQSFLERIGKVEISGNTMVLGDRP